GEAVGPARQAGPTPADAVPSKSRAAALYLRQNSLKITSGRLGMSGGAAFKRICPRRQADSPFRRPKDGTADVDCGVLDVAIPLHAPLEVKGLGAGAHASVDPVEGDPAAPAGRLESSRRKKIATHPGLEKKRPRPAGRGREAGQGGAAALADQR